MLSDYRVGSLTRDRFIRSPGILVTCLAIAGDHRLRVRARRIGRSLGIDRSVDGNVDSCRGRERQCGGRPIG